MSTRARDIIGKPVVSAETGERLGTVSDLLLDDLSHHLVGIVVAHGMLKSEEVLPAAAVQTFGRDAVISRTGEMIPAREWRESHVADVRPDDSRRR
jgi:uncharacterized protein YrrD